jgi:hypothetical protein
MIHWIQACLGTTACKVETLLINNNRCRISNRDLKWHSRCSIPYLHNNNSKFLSSIGTCLLWLWETIRWLFSSTNNSWRFNNNSSSNSSSLLSKLTLLLPSWTLLLQSWILPTIFCPLWCNSWPLSLSRSQCRLSNNKIIIWICKDINKEKEITADITTIMVVIRIIIDKETINRGWISTSKTDKTRVATTVVRVPLINLQLFHLNWLQMKLRGTVSSSWIFRRSIITLAPFISISKSMVTFRRLTLIYQREVPLLNSNQSSQPKERPQRTLTNQRISISSVYLKSVSSTWPRLV